MQRNVPEIKEENTGLGVIIVRLEKVQKVLKEKGFPFTWTAARQLVCGDAGIGN